MNKEMLKEIMNNMDVVKELDEYGKNRLAPVKRKPEIYHNAKKKYTI